MLKLRFPDLHLFGILLLQMASRRKPRAFLVNPAEQAGVSRGIAAITGSSKESLMK